LLALADTVAAQATLIGYVFERQTGGPRVANAEVSAEGANRVLSNNDGRFELQFAKLKPGEPTRLSVRYRDWVVVNHLVVGQPVLPSQPALRTLEVLVSPPGEREMLALDYYQIRTSESVNAAHQEKLRELEEKNALSAQALELLQRQHERALTESQALAKQLAAVQEGAPDASYRQATRLVAQGNTHAALQVLNRDRLRKEAEAAKQAAETVSRNFLLRARLLAVNLRFEEAEASYEDALKMFPQSYSLWVGYGTLHYNIQEYAKAERGFQQALRIAEAEADPWRVAGSLNDLALSQMRQARYDEATKTFQKALATVRAQTAEPSRSRGEAANLLNNLSLVYSEQNRLAEARTVLEEAADTQVDLLKKFIDRVPGYETLDLYALADSRNNLANLHRELREYRQARKRYNEAIRVLEFSVHEQRVDLARVLRNRAYLESEDAQHDAAHRFIEAALKISREFAGGERDPHKSELAATLTILGKIQSGQGLYAEAEKSLEEALAIHDRMRASTRRAYGDERVDAELLLGQVHLAQARPDRARLHFEKALALAREAARETPRAVAAVADVLINIGELNRREKRHDAARGSFAEAMQILEPLARANPVPFKEYLTRARAGAQSLEKIN
jgi:tetratricopeptide (TPR) repeat protein